MKHDWENYHHNNFFVGDITWSMVVDSVRKLFECCQIETYECLDVKHEFYGSIREGMKDVTEEKSRPAINIQ